LEEGSLSNLLLLLVGRKCSQSKKEATSYRQEEEEEEEEEELSVHSAPHQPSSPKLLKVLHLKGNCKLRSKTTTIPQTRTPQLVKTQKTQKRTSSTNCRVDERGKNKRTF
jgi:hypothetical protein